MEEPLRTAIEDIDKSAIGLIDKDGIVLNGEIKHQMFNFVNNGQKETLVMLLEQYL